MGDEIKFQVFYLIVLFLCYRVCCIQDTTVFLNRMEIW
jgi:hypothetical protein